MMRERMSRPRGSVPRGCPQVPPVSHTGGIRRSPTAWRYGSWGETHGARTAAATATSTIPLPTARNRSRLIPRRGAPPMAVRASEGEPPLRAPGPCGRVAAKPALEQARGDAIALGPMTRGPSCLALPPEADPRIQIGDGDIGQEVGDDDEQRQEHHGPLDDRVVVGADRLHRQRGDSRPGENRFSDDGTSEEP